MKRLIFILLIFGACNFVLGQNLKFVSSDIDNFWQAYDKISTTKDTTLHKKYLNELYLNKASIGLQSLLEVRNYADNEILNSIYTFPNFWNSLRQNSLNTQVLYPEIETDIKNLKKYYPELKPSTIFFLIGAFRTGGTRLNDRVLIGSELSLCDENTFINEHPQFRQDFIKNYQPKKNIALLCTHEYIHTQQNQPVNNLLSWCIYEGIAEFISCKATGKKSNSPSISFGKLNQKAIFRKFEDEMFFPNWSNWLWGENSNEFKIRDLGYYIGYEISEQYYDLSEDKSKAIKELIELDYNNEQGLERIVDFTKVFSNPLKIMWEDYNKKRPTVLSVSPIKKNKKLNPGVIKMEITFSEKMDTKFSGFDYGPLGENHIYKFKKAIGWSNDDKTFKFEVEVNSSKLYQSLVSSNFRNKKGIRLQQYLIEFETKKN